ncbi:MAG: polyphenol oxidase family protein [Nitrospinae bacterium]|nr:polyphenol oxidase family protein [Nitrospinota bacterium]
MRRIFGELLLMSHMTRHERDGIAWYSYDDLDKLGWLANWVTTRNGGQAKHGFDLARNSGEAGVMENRHKAADLFAGGHPIFLPRQVHGTIVCSATGGGREADAVLITGPNQPAGVLTADCLPIILADTRNRAAAVIHAGRQGVFDNIIAAAIARLTGAPKDLVAVIGPAIRSCCYEVKDGVFAGGYDSFKRFLAKGRLDIAAAAKEQLLAAGVPEAAIFDSGICTSCRTDEFYSHRAEKGDTGRFMTGIMIRPSGE